MTEFEKFKHFCENVLGVDAYAAGSFIIFFSIFMFVLFWAFKADKKMLDEINNLPLSN